MAIARPSDRGTVRDPEFADARVMITGAAGVVGTWIAQAFARSRAHLLLSDVRTGKLSEAEAAGQYEGAAGVWIHGADLREPQSISTLVAAVGERWGAVDVLVNNAGIYPRDRLLEGDIDKWREVLDVNLVAPYYLTSLMATQMVNARVRGAIVNITSGAAVTVTSGGVIYSVSKAALSMFTRGAAIELAPYGIRVNAVAPGYAPGSDLTPHTDDHVAAMVRTIPLGRTGGPDDAAAAVLYLASHRAAFVTGTVLSVDGGRTAGGAAG